MLFGPLVLVFTYVRQSVPKNQVRCFIYVFLIKNNLPVYFCLNVLHLSIAHELFRVLLPNTPREIFVDYVFLKA